MEKELINALNMIRNKYKDLFDKLSEVEIVSNYELCQRYAREKSRLEPVIRVANILDIKNNELNDVTGLIAQKDQGDEFKQMAADEKTKLEKDISTHQEELKKLILKTLMVPEKYKNVIIEIRAGTGGEEAGLFAADLFKMYSRFAQNQEWKLEVMDSNPTDIGGFKEIIFSISDDDAYQKLKYESGIHRVQRVPQTEAGGRIHTSAVSVVVLPEPEEVEVAINQKDLKIDTYRSSGAGGQHVNVTDSAVRITHLPTGIIVACQDERSQIKNRQKAMRVLKARILDYEKRQQEKKVSAQRKKSVGSGDRSEKIRTYNFQEGRVTDHRIGLTLYRLEQILNGDMDEVVENLLAEDRRQFLENICASKNESK